VQIICEKDVIWVSEKLNKKKNQDNIIGHQPFTEKVKKIK